MTGIVRVTGAVSALQSITATLSTRDWCCQQYMHRILKGGGDCQGFHLHLWHFKYRFKCKRSNYGKFCHLRWDQDTNGYWHCPC